MPAPIIPADDFSGRVTLRLAKSLHRSLAQAADREGVSLNQHLTNILNCYAGYAQATKARNSGNIGNPYHNEFALKKRQLSRLAISAGISDEPVRPNAFTETNVAYHAACASSA